MNTLMKGIGRPHPHLPSHSHRFSFLLIVAWCFSELRLAEPNEHRHREESQGDISASEKDLLDEQLLEDSNMNLEAFLFSQTEIFLKENFPEGKWEQPAARGATLQVWVRLWLKSYVRC